MNDDYRRALDAALREYEQATAERTRLDARIAELHQSISTLTKLCGYTPTVALGLTEACTLALRGSDAPMTAVDVRDRLLAIGFDLERYTNPLSAIHTTLKRLALSGDAESVAPGRHGRIAYRRPGSPRAGAAEALRPRKRHRR